MAENELGIRYGVKKFNGNSNEFRNWKIRVECALKEKKCWSAIGSLFDTKESDKEGVNEALNDTAKAIIVSTITDNVLDEVYNDRANVMWAKLLSKYEKLDVTGVHFIRQRFFNCKQEKNETVENYITRVQTYKGQLDHTDQKVNDTDVIMQIYGGVLPEFTHFVQIIIVNKDTKDLNLNDFKMALINEEKRQRDANNTENSINEVYFSKQKNSKEKKKFSKRTNGCYNCNGESHEALKCKFPKNKCFKCGELGHLAPYCDLVKERNGKQDISLATIKQNKEQEFVFWCNENNSKDKISWFLDSGATNHICCMRESFKTIQTFKSKVITANGNEIPIEGKGIVELETITNGKRIKIKMTDVLFAPMMKINLISIGKLTKRGFSLIFNDNDCTIKLGNRLVTKLDQWKYNTNLYELRVIPKTEEKLKQVETRLNTRKIKENTNLKEASDEYVVLDLSTNDQANDKKVEGIKDDMPPLENVENGEERERQQQTNETNESETNKATTTETETEELIGNIFGTQELQPANETRIRKQVKQFQPGLSDKEIRANRRSSKKQGEGKDPPDTNNKDYEI